jgi:hypothetical protein
MLVPRSASTSATSGTATISEAKNVNLGSVYFEDYVTGALTDITTSWKTNECVTQGYSGSPSLSGAGTAIDAACTFSNTDTETLWLETEAVCQGFVKSVHYTVKHASSVDATITSVTADVTLSDVPISSLDGTDAAVTVVQSFGVDFYSFDDTDQSSTNGNLVLRCVYNLNSHSICVLITLNVFLCLIPCIYWFVFVDLAPEILVICSASPCCMRSSQTRTT